VENWEELQVNIQNVTTQLFYFKNQGTISITRSLLRNISLRSFYDLDYDYFRSDRLYSRKNINVVNNTALFF